jgi:hypothetical protein
LIHVRQIKNDLFHFLSSNRNSSSSPPLIWTSYFKLTYSFNYSSKGTYFHARFVKHELMLQIGMLFTNVQPRRPCLKLNIVRDEFIEILLFRNAKNALLKLHYVCFQCFVTLMNMAMHFDILYYIVIHTMFSFFAKFPMLKFNLNLPKLFSIKTCSSLIEIYLSFFQLKFV